MSFVCKKLITHKISQTSWRRRDSIGSMLLGQEGGLTAVSHSGMPQLTLLWLVREYRLRQ